MNVIIIIIVVEYKGESVFISPIIEPNSVMFLDLRFYGYIEFLAQLYEINLTQ